MREELNRAENAGLKTFLIRVYQIAFRIQRFFQGIGEGFSAAIEAAAPVFEAFVGALTRLGQALGLVAGESANAAAGIPSDDFAAFGRILGQIAGVLVEVFVGALTFVIDVVTSAINTFRSAMAPLQPVFDAVKNAVSLVFQELGKLGAMFGFTSSASGQAGGSLDALRSVAEFLGTVIGYVAAGIAGAIGVMVSFVVNRLAVIIAAFRSVVGFIGGVVDILGGLVTGNWAQVWVGFKKVVLNTINFLAQLLLGFVETIAGVIDTIAGVFGADLGGADAIRSLRQDIERGLLEGVDEVTAGVTVAPAGSTLTALDAATSTMPAVAAMTPAVPASFPMTPATPAASPPITVNLQVDGTTLATAVHRAAAPASRGSYTVSTMRTSARSIASRATRSPTSAS